MHMHDTGREEDVVQQAVWGLGSGFLIVRLLIHENVYNE